MLGPKEFTGLVLEGDAIKMARVKVEGNKLRLLKLDQFSLVEPIKTKSPSQAESFEETDSFEEELDADSIFGFEDEEEDEEEDEVLGELDLDNLDEEEQEEDTMSLDMVEE